MERTFPLMIPSDIYLAVRRKQRAKPKRRLRWASLEPHDYQARKNHCDQSLEVLARRGGLCPWEALAVLTDRSWKVVHDIGLTFDQVMNELETLGAFPKEPS